MDIASPARRASSPAPEAQEAELRRLRRLAWVLDASLRVPGTRFRVGVDGLIGLVPGVGDLAGGLVSAWLVWRAHRLGARRRVLARMAGNALVEAVLGTVPVLGDLFDFGFKANLRNVRLLERALAAAEPRPAAAS